MSGSALGLSTKMNIIAKQVSDGVQMIDANIVLVANEVNVSIFTLAWMLENGIVDSKDLDGEVTVTNLTVFLKTNQFELTIVPNRVQLSLKPSKLSAESSAERTLIRILEVLPHTPIYAVGLNIAYMLTPPTSTSFTEWNEQLFSPSLKLTPDLESHEGIRFGTYISWDVLGSRLRLDVKPMNAQSKDGSQIEFMRAGFNYHTELSQENPTEDAVELIHRWSDVLEHSLEVARTISTK